MSASRRDFMRIAVLAGGASFLGVSTARAAATDALLLSCMDYRLTEATERYMASRGLRKKYDHVVLAGAALGAVTASSRRGTRPSGSISGSPSICMRSTRSILLDHRDCGAYKVILGEDFAKDRAKETTVHATQLRELQKQILAKHPKLAVELVLMSLDGKTEKISAA